MISMSAEAAEQIRLSAEKTASESMALRIAAKVAVDESVEYGLGFDEKRDDDMSFNIQGIDIVIAKDSAELLNGAHLDFVEIEPGNFNFIFQNPNDPNYKPPTENE